MSDLIDFLTSKEIIIVYIISGLSCLICFLIYLAEKNNEKLRRRHNTKELNKLVKQIKEEVVIEKDKIYEEPIISPINEYKQSPSVTELLEETGKLKKNNESQVIEPYIIEPKKEETSIYDLEPVIIESKPVELKYTTIEPDQETAKKELRKLEAELIEKEKAKEIEDKNQNIKLTDYEEEQEKTAIISLEELVKKGKEMYAANEISQYQDEGNEPISIQDLEKKLDKKTASIEDTFIIENVVPKETLQEIKSLEETPTENKPETQFKSSPIISPIFGIERINNVEANDLELENTANYEKLDAEIKKTNEFLMTLKDLQGKLD